ncbi:MAG TPA: sulfite exporter TauE/SafE family protein [Gaiellaceae bacterium]|nr:sulfite exporter TauE/SafE family protein [Gaiellaceae bacterium]
MRRLLLLVTACYLLVPAAAASAHPLGNFTINRFARVEVAGDRLYVRYVVDMAEIPTLQHVPVRIGGLRVIVDGHPVDLKLTRTALAHPQGAAGLRTTRFQAILAGPRVTTESRVAVVDSNYANRIGWKEIVLGAGTRSTSDELRAYPKDLLRSPLEITHASGTLAPNHEAPPTLLSGKALAAPDRVADSRFAALIGQRHLSALVVLVSMLLAVFWGAAHALSPGHGKTIVSAYMVGSRGTPWHAALLGLITTATHTAGVFALGGVTLLLSQWIVPDRLYPWLDLSAGLMVVVVGLAVLAGRARHAHAHSHGHHHEHRSLLAVGISGGLLPCPSALVVLLAAISLHRVAFGMLLVVAFSLGLAVAITTVGLVAVVARRAFARFDGRGRLLTLLPAVSAVVIVIAGVAMVARALPKVSV